MAELESPPASAAHPTTLSFHNVSFRPSRGANNILESINGSISGGQMLALMGPSGAGKTTLLDLLAGRNASTEGQVLIDGSEDFDMFDLSTYVEQDDSLLGVLTVRETVLYAARLSATPHTSSSSLESLVDGTLKNLGLSHIANHKIGTPIQRGISGGQKRRVTIACSVVCRKRILVLDEPTSGLDSYAAKEVITAVRILAQSTNAIIICSIHQPSFETISLFDKLLFLNRGKTIYLGPVSSLGTNLSKIGYNVPEHYNPVDYLMELTNQDFSEKDETRADLSQLLSAPPETTLTELNYGTETETGKEFQSALPILTSSKVKPTFVDQISKGIRITYILSSRNFKNYSRNLLAFGIRFAMYLAMGFMVAVIWLHLGRSDIAIDDRLSILFYSVAFLSFMSVAGVPSYLEERSVYIRERKNGFYGPLPFLLANTITTIPFMFLCALAFTLLAYWAIPLKGGAGTFWIFLLTVFLSVYVAESQAILISSIIPLFVASLAITAFANGLWMSVQGYFIRYINLPGFWKSWVHWIDYETFSFNILANNEFRGTIFSCQQIENSCQCAYPSSLPATACALKGEDVLQALNILDTKIGLYIGILIIITFVYRLLIFGALLFKKNS